MNDPNHTDRDRGMLDDLEAEYLALIAKGDGPAFDYAMDEYRPFRCTVNGNVMAILQTPAGANALLAECIRQRLFEVLAEHVAPLWALAELPKRVAATDEMLAEWAAEPAA